MKHGFVKVAAAAPALRIADPMYNAEKIGEVIQRCADDGVKVLVLPELALTGATCGDLFYQNTLLRGAVLGLEKVIELSIGADMLTFVGLPVEKDGKIYNCAAAVCDGDLLGVVPMRTPGDKHFAVADDKVREVKLGSIYPTFFSSQLLFRCNALGNLIV